MTWPIILTVAAGFGFVAVLLVVLLLSTSVASPLKVGAALAASVLAVGVYWGAGELRGWPSDTSLPTNFQLHWFRIAEPNPLTADAGSVFLWIEALDANSYPSGQPRAYRLAYSRELADKLTAVLPRLAQGDEIAGAAAPDDAEADTAERLSREVVLESGGARAPGTGGEAVHNFDPAGMTFADLKGPTTPEKK